MTSPILEDARQSIKQIIETDFGTEGMWQTDPPTLLHGVLQITKGNVAVRDGGVLLGQSTFAISLRGRDRSPLKGDLIIIEDIHYRVTGYSQDGQAGVRWLELKRIQPAAAENNE